MLSVFICEDDPGQRKRLEEIIEKNIMIEDYPMTVTLASDNPYAILEYLEENEDVRGIYFLDVELGHELNGIQLAAKIRKNDPDAKIIFVTTHSELLSLTFNYKVEALDYIIKDQPEQMRTRIHECLAVAHDYFTSESKKEEQRIKLKVNNQIRIFPMKEIMFFETTEVPHKINLHLTNSTVELYETLNNLEKQSEAFVRVHKSYLINKENIQAISRKNREVMMTNGEVCLASARKMRLLE